MERQDSQQQATRRGFLIVFSGPAGVGKDTLIDQWKKVVPTLRRVVTYTTRPPAPEERHGVDYLFVSEERFQQLLQENAFLEHAFVHGHWYGTPSKEIEQMRSDGLDVVLRIDVQGGVQVKQKYPDALLIFIQPPSLQELENRLRKRGRDSEEAIRLRIENAQKEMEYIPHYDYLVTNDNLHRALETLRCILIAERHRVARLKP